MELIKFIREPLVGENVKVLTHPPRYGKIASVTTDQVHDDNYKSVVNREVLVLDECDEMPIYKLDYILPLQKVKFNTK